MPVITGGVIIEGVTGRAVPVPGAPVAGTNEVQTLTIGGTPTGGSFQLVLNGQATTPIAWSATNATLLANIQAALDTMFGEANAVVAAAGSLTAGIGTITLTYSGLTFRRALQTTLTYVNNLTGTSPTLAVAKTTPGVDATYRSASTGTQIVRLDTGVLYVNTSTTLNQPTWTVVGTQT
jgi:hypothetical protein